MPDSQDEEDDYLSMTIIEPEKPRFEGSAQRRARREREAEERSRPKSKVVQANEQAQARDEALSKHIDESTKGFKMLRKLGYKPGKGLGVEDRIDARLEPIGIEMREHRSGLGLDAEKKRKFREETQTEAKRLRATEHEYRDRVARERLGKRTEGLWKGAMSVLERLEAFDDAGGGASSERKLYGDAPVASKSSTGSQHAAAMGVELKCNSVVPLYSVNLLYRSLVRERMSKERERRMRFDLSQSLARSPAYDDDDAEKDRDHLSKKTSIMDESELEDLELDEFEALDPETRLGRVVKCLREQHRYCFWCKYQYSDSQLEGCPGLSEDDHD